MRQRFFLSGCCFVPALIFCCSSYLLGAERLSAYPPTTGWQAEWMTVAGLPQPVPPNLWLAFRKEFEWSARSQPLRCRIACDSKYWLYVNGKPLVREGQLKRGPTPRDTYYDIVDMTGSLKEGKNCIALLVWYFGKEGFSHKNSGMPGLLVDGSTGGDADRSLLSDATWKAVCLTSRDETAETPVTGKPFAWKTADPQPNYRLPESNIRFDARADSFLHDRSWARVGFDDSSWPGVKVSGKPPVAPWNELYARPIPLFKDFGLKSYENAAELPAVSDGTPVRCKLPYNAQITPYFEIEAEAGKVIDIRTDDYRGGGEYNVRAEYVTRSGRQSFESPGWMNGHEIVYTIPAGIAITSLQYRESGYDTEFTGSFHCDDPFYDRLWTKAVRTLYVTMRDTYFDCPDRERAQWWGDAVNELGEAFYALDLRSALLARKGFYELVRWQKPDGVLYSPIPSGNWTKELPMQMLATIGTYGIGTYALYNDDWPTAYDLYPAMKKYMALFRFGEDGLVLHRTGAWDWGDWGDNIDLRVLTNCWYYLALKMRHRLASDLGKTGDVALVRAEMKRIRENFDKVFWTGTEYRDPKYAKKTDDRANAMAVIAGLAGPEKHEAIRKVLAERRHASPYMEKYVLESLFQMRFAEDALRRMKERFEKMVMHEEYSTLWEGWGIGKEGFGGGTINHAWSGGGLTCLAQYVTGLEPTAPAFKTFQVLPQLGSIRSVSQTTPTRYGPISIVLDRRENGFRLEVVVPPETSAVIGVPKEYVPAVERLAVPVTAAPADESNAHYWLYRVIRSGNHVFETGR